MLLSLLIKHARNPPYSANVLLTMMKHHLPGSSSSSSRHRRVISTPPRRRIIQRLNIRPPLLSIRPEYSPVVRKQPIDFPLNVRRLRPDASRAGELVDLVAELGEQLVRAVVVGFVGLVDFVGLVYRVDGLLHVPETAYVSLY